MVGKPGTIILSHLLVPPTLRSVYGASSLRRLQALHAEDGSQLQMLRSYHSSKSFKMNWMFPLISRSAPPSEQNGFDNVINFMKTFVQEVSLSDISEGEAGLNWQPSDTERQALTKAVEVFDTRSPEFQQAPHITWLGRYGCALVASVQRVGQVQLSIICLDEWAFKMHSGLGKRTQVSQAGCDAAVRVFVGHVDKDKYEDFLELFVYLLLKSEKRTGDQRSANANKQGNQKTPALIQAILKDAIDGLDSPVKTTSPRGGFTDVGLHTGGGRRNTCWPLVQAVMQTMLDTTQHNSLYRVAMAQMKLRYVEHSIATSSSSTCLADALSIDTLMQMLKATVLEGAAIVDLENHGMASFPARCVAVRSELDGALLARANHTARACALPRQLDVPCRDAKLILPQQATPSKHGTDDLDAIRLQARANLGGLVMPPTPATWLGISQWLDQSALQSPQDDAAMLLVLRTVEAFTFKQACDFLGSEDKASMLDASSLFADVMRGLDVVENVVKKYCIAVANFRKSKAFNAMLSVEIDSSELLVVWVAFCVSHHVTKQSDRLLAEYSVALHWNDLSHLVLSDRLSVDAARHVASYLRRFSSARTGRPPVFSLRSDDSTFEFARCHARASPTMLSFWEAEQTAAATRQKDHWDEVLIKQVLLRRLDSELRKLQAKRTELQGEFAATEAPRVTNRRSIATTADNDRRHYAAESALESINSQIMDKEKEIKKAESPPAPIMQPLPAEESAAMPVVFFLNMPADHQVLSRLSFAAQEMLLPAGSTIYQPVIAAEGNHIQHKIDSLIKVGAPNTDWRQYFLSKSHQSNIAEPKVILGSYEIAEPSKNKWYPENVRDYYKPSDGIWHPDKLRPALFWKGGGFSLDQREYYFNPFASVPHEATVHKFTESLPQPIGEKNMQPWMEQHGHRTAPIRSNWPMAVQDDRLHWLAGKAQFLAFGALRAYPFQQLRKLCVAMRDRSLPFGNPCVRVLLQQTVFHLGDLSDEDMPRPLWRTDMNCHDGWAVLRRELEGLADELRCKPREHGAILILGELAAVASQWNPLTRTVARDFAAISRKWSEDIEIEIEKATIDNIPTLRARQCLFRMYSIVCHSAGELTERDVSALIQLVVLAENSRVFEDPTSYDDQVRALTAVTCGIMANRLSDVLQVLDKHPELLTAAAKLVLEQTPHHLEWRRLASDDGSIQSQCYEAVSPFKTLYHINVQTGVLLLDGLPPRRLPATILAMPLYKRCFNDRNFEVVQNKMGMFETTRSISGRIYKFFVSNDQLVVHEFDPVRSLTLELLDYTVGQWSSDLPIRLREMHSHWLCRSYHGSSDIVLLRKINFLERDIQFLLENTVPLSPRWSCFRVDEHLALQTHWTALYSSREDFDRLKVLENSQVPHSAQQTLVDILQKFETEPGLIHVFSTAQGGILIELPRYDLSFSLIDGKLHSNNYRGMTLSPQQQLHDDALLGFTQYLILESGDLKKVIVPTGEVVRDSTAVFVSGSSAYDADRKFHCYDVHPRFETLEVGAGPLAVEARLQLAALYAATDSEVPSLRHSQTGGAMAMELVRQSWVNRPLSSTEHGHLVSICRFAELTPALPLLCKDLDESGRELHFLHPATQSNPPLPDIADAGTEYSQRKQSESLNARAFLTADEETRVLGLPVAARPKGRAAPPDASNPGGSLSLPPTYLLSTARSTDRETASIEQNLRQLIMDSKQAGADNALPVEMTLNATDFNATKIGINLMDVLKSSWDMHQSTPSTRMKPIEQAKETLVVLYDRAKTLRLEQEQELLRVITLVPEDARCSHVSVSVFTMRRAANLEPTVTRRDLVRAALAPEHLWRFNPFFSRTAVMQLQDDILAWLKNCVLEDKLKRMLKLAIEGNSQELERELQNIGRKWEVKAHPQWLAFEVEGQLQIRHVQYALTQFLLDNPGSIAQLNMGEGKTRVILPMLLLGQSKSDSTLMRLHFLSPLLGEAYHFLHRHLTASLMNRRLCLLPFHRDVKVDSNRALKMLDSLHRCEASLGAVFVAPEHRLSLKLKWDELYQANLSHTLPVRAILEDIEKMAFYDIFDESDEMLRHKYQLVYAVGACGALPGGKERWEVAQAVLKQLQRHPGVAAILQRPDVSLRVSMLADRGAGVFDNLRLLSGKALEYELDALLRHVANGIIDDPPHHLRWLENHSLRHLIVDFVADSEKSLDWFDSQHETNAINELQRQELLALRGFLACGLLEHCLCLRYRVNYGVDPKRGKSRRVAVPYRASDTPADRAEYSQPDTLILLTLLSYYHDGLSCDEVKEAGQVLLSLGPNAQRAEYSLWLDSARATMTAEQLLALDNVDKLDLSNEVQLRLLHSTYRYNMAAINFWLDSCVFPRETMQFPHRLVTNAYNLVDNAAGKQVGFSGTKDNYLLLPRHVTQGMSDEPAMVATDGKMLDLVCSPVNNRVQCFHSSMATLSAEIIAYAAQNNVDALIDAGATMAGLSNREVADMVLKLLPSNSRLQGVVYFVVASNTWHLINRRGRSWPLGSSPIQERDAFVYFDESRCRGADMKLLSQATAVLTVGQNMCKDKLMQAAGRMRKLEYGQKLIFAVPPDVASKIRAAHSSLPADSPLQPEHIVKWTMQNTVLETAIGMPESAAQGSHFATTQHPLARRIDETLELTDLYAKAIRKQEINGIVKDRMTRDKKRIEKLQIDIDSKGKVLLESIEQHAKEYGSDWSLRATGLDEECERELENEREQQREIERQVPRQAPRGPLEWDFSSILTAATPQQLDPLAHVMPLKDAVAEFWPALSDIHWDKCRIFVTRNFADTVMDLEGAALEDLSEYMRPVDAVVTFCSLPSSQSLAPASYLLLSEWEAEKVTEQMQSVAGSFHVQLAISMSPLSYLCKAADEGWRAQPHFRLPFSSGSSDIDRAANEEHALAGLCLFSGYTLFKTSARQRALADLLPTAAAKRAALKLPAMRGCQHMVSRSHLEAICAVDIGEA